MANINNFVTEGDYTIKQKPVTVPGKGRNIGGMVINGDYTYTPQSVTRSGQTGQVVSPKSGAQSTTGITAPKSTSYLPNTARRQEAAKAPYNSGTNTYGARALMRAAGLDDESIGYDGQYVTYKGNKLFVPSVVENGTSYASKPTIYSGINTALANDGVKLVQANKYQNKYGIADGLGYNAATGEVTVGGVPIDYAYIDEGGNAWVDENVISGAYDNYAKSLGVREPGYYKKEYDDEAALARKAQEEAVDRLRGWNMTEGELRTDPIYRAYAKQYIRDGAKAYKNAMGQMAAQTGGGLSSAAIAAAGAAQNEYMGELADRVPEIMQYAYERFRNGEEAAMDSANQRRTDAYNKYAIGYGENRDNIERQDAQSAAAYNRFINDVALKDAREDLGQKEYDNIFAKGQKRGYFTDGEKYITGGTNPFAGEVSYNEVVAKPLYEFEKKTDDEYAAKASEREVKNDAYLLGINNANDLAKLYAQYKYDDKLNNTKFANEKELAEQDFLYDLVTNNRKAEYDGDELVEVPELEMEDGSTPEEWALAKILGKYLGE